MITVMIIMIVLIVLVELIVLIVTIVMITKVMIPSIVFHLDFLELVLLTLVFSNRREFLIDSIYASLGTQS